MLEHVSAPAGTVSLRTAMGVFVSGDAKGPNGVVAATRMERSEKETFVLEPAPGGDVALRCAAKVQPPRFLSARNPRADVRATAVGKTERFALYDVDTARAHGLYKSAPA